MMRGLSDDGLHPSLIYIALSGLAWLILHRSGLRGLTVENIRPVRTFQGVILRWAAPIAGIFRPFRTGVLY
ncbi:hypothetical protein DHB64_05445 [Antarcticibacterium sp. W02-3]|nr:hypothetical protein [Antarcticibacterium sp. W02-3]